MALTSYLAGEVVEDFADGRLDRREALRRLGLLGVGMAAAAGLLAACSSGGRGEQAATTTAPPTSTTAAAGEPIRFPGPRGELLAAYAAPAGAPRAAVLVVHENRGLTAHFYDLVRRFAAEGYAALCVDLLSEQGGTASLPDPAAAPTALSNAGTDALVADLRAGIDELQRRVPGVKVGEVGFCFGGAMSWYLLQAGEARLSAVIPFYGPSPEPADFTRAKAAVLGIYAGNDQRVNASKPAAEAGLQAAGLVHEIKVYDGADHAFFNDTGPRYNPEAAAQAWAAVLDWFGRYLS
ncbi:MAG TPA: dienelactone hydrolase family protein [Acidimicrobiales bacterium]|nr:dienelactone hydrolase family protein [Acidimicrobiales bacterium]